MQLRAGRLTMQYADGFLRYISVGNTELLRMIYFAIRDESWRTIPSRIRREEIKKTETGFYISYERHFDEGEIKMIWQTILQGTEDSGIRFSIKGRAGSAFKKNRAGFCVLHPIQGCAGNPVRITHTDGLSEEMVFPVSISPHQPFKDIAAMDWDTGSNRRARLLFTGDVFETEDQRNWTDNSYKTYCTPLDIPFPVLLRENEELEQRIFLSLDDAPAPEEESAARPMEIRYTPDIALPIPAIGIGRAATADADTRERLKDLAGIGFSHYRTDIRLRDADWENILGDALAECRLMQTKLELAVFLPQEYQAAVTRLLSLPLSENDIKSIILLEADQPCIRNELLAAVFPLFRKRFPRVSIGGGTDLHFTELNRSALSFEPLDFVSYSINPQAHAFDDATLVENAGAQGYTVDSALLRFKKPVHISPVTLKRRPAADERQSGPGCASWTISSLKYLIGHGAASITYFETLGNKGIMPTTTGSPFPVFYVFRELLSGRWTHMVPCESSSPFAVDALMLGNAREKILMLVNHTATSQSVLITADAKNGSAPGRVDIGPACYAVFPC